MKHFTMKYFVLAIVTILSFTLLPVVHAQHQGYYIDDGRSISRVPNVDPETVKVEEWHVRLYKRGQATGGRDHWGLISGKSAAKVMAELRSSQEFEKRWCRWVKIDYPELFTYTNYLGPIAVVRKPKPASARVLERATSLYSRFKQGKELFSKISQILSDTPRASNPFKNVGNVLKEYTHNLHDAQKRLRDLQRRVNDIVPPAQSTIDAGIAQITRDLEASERHVPILTRALNEARGGTSRSRLAEGRFDVTARSPQGEVRASDHYAAKVVNGNLEYTEIYNRLYVASGSRIEGETRVHCRLPDLDADGMTLGKILPFNSEDVVAWQITIPTKNMRKAIVIDHMVTRENGKEQERPSLFDEDYQYLRLRFSTEEDARAAMELLRTAIKATH